MAVVRCNTCSSASCRPASSTAKLDEVRQALAERIFGCSDIGTSSPYSSFACASFSQIVGECSQCVTIITGASEKIFSRTSGIVNQHVSGRCTHENFYAAGLPNLELYESRRCCDWLRQNRNRSSRCSDQQRPGICVPARPGFVVCGSTLGMSMKLVTPPAAAALDSVAKSALCVKPGSRK